MSTITVTSDNLENVIEQHAIVIIDFWAPWCSPCLAFSPIFERVAAEFPDIVFAKVNIDDEKALSDSFQIQSIPFLVVFKEGIVIYAEAGSMPYGTLKDLVIQAIAADTSGLVSDE
jgi:thioredoxin 1